MNIIWLDLGYTHHHQSYILNLTGGVREQYELGNISFLKKYDLKKLRIYWTFFTLLSISGCSPDLGKIAGELNAYGNEVAASFEEKMSYDSLVQTLEKPKLSYVLKFSTNAAEFMSEPGADVDRVKFLANLGRTEIWQAKVCNKKIRQLMTEHKIFILSFNLTNMSGETQAMGVCTAN